MSHNPHAAVVCPNCGHHAEYNYCAQCGQPTHLHKDTFIGLIVHFVAHYFHYDSKFWKTLKTLWIKPGALTIAYRNKQRMRYIDPISLYIFVSAVFFLFFFIKADQKVKELSINKKFVVYKDASSDTVHRTKIADGTYITTSNQDEPAFTLKIDSSKGNVLKKEPTNQWQRASRNFSEKAEYRRAFFNTLIHSIPKAVFFMIPVMALVLQVLFIRRKEAFFVDHGIFSLHYHTFWFSIMLLRMLNPFEILKTPLTLTLIFIGMVYFIVALKKTYNISYRRSVAYSMVIGSLYSFVLFWLLVGGVFYVFYLQGT